jgi:hypothetical protein
MAARLIIAEAFNLFAGDGVQEEGKHLTITNITPPAMKDMTADHKAGGAVGALSVGGLGLEALELSFKLAGYDPQTKAQMDGGGASQRFTAYGAMRDKQTGATRELKIVVFGRMQEMTPAEMSRGDLGDQDHKIGEITHYEEYLDGKEVYFYDWPTVMFRTNGVDQWAARRSILRI